MYTMQEHLTEALNAIRTEGLYKSERILTTAQSSHVGVIVPRATKPFQGTVLILCANNYLGLAQHPVITHRFHFSDFQQGFDIMRSGNCGKVILDWK